jgi:hypothetical protein
MIIICPKSSTLDRPITETPLTPPSKTHTLRDLRCPTARLKCSRGRNSAQPRICSPLESSFSESFKAYCLCFRLTRWCQSTRTKPITQGSFLLRRDLHPSVRNRCAIYCCSWLIYACAVRIVVDRFPFGRQSSSRKY